ncbi:MAG: hypothetical protein IJS92_06525 [Paludibacteraceae bacterium]|nr:hypothetical protein [Paludibacteraceae bacterium]MBR0309894.1 hypothetical protein [Paludibacteraceae bacterium]
MKTQIAPLFPEKVQFGLAFRGIWVADVKKNQFGENLCTQNLQMWHFFCIFAV